MQVPQATNVFKGNILFFYAFDIGEEVSLDVVKNQGLVSICDVYLSAFFKNYHAPLAFSSRVDGTQQQSETRLSSKIYHFGVMSLCYRIPFEQSFENLKLHLIELEREYDERSEADARHAFEAISPAIRKPNFYNSKSSYFAVQVYPIKDKITAEEFKDRYGARIASLLRLETQNLSDYQKDEILDSATGYYGEDLIIIDTEAAFVYDDEYLEPLEFFESTNIEKVELQYFDRLLDQKLNYFYSQDSYKVPFRAYFPLVGERIDLPVSRLVKLRVDISVVTERLENSIKLTGDAYYSKMYAILVEKLLLKEWRESINRKLDIIKDLYTVYQDRLDTVHEEILTLVIIVLIGVELFVAFMR